MKNSPNFELDIFKLLRNVDFGAGCQSVSRLSSGEVDYDFPTKVAWRHKWVEFIKNNFSPQELAEAKVLCMPTYDMAREVRLYLELGIQPSNIFAFENKKQLFQRFETNCNAVGINPVCGDLNILLPNMKEKFSIVNFDFPGMFCLGYMTILENVLVAPKAAVCINLMSGRENTRSKQGLAAAFDQDLSELARERWAHITSGDKEWLGLPEAHESLNRNSEMRKQARDGADVGELRDLIAEKVLLSRISSNRADNFNLRNDYLSAILKHDEKHHGNGVGGPAYFYLVGGIELELRHAVKQRHIRFTEFGGLDPNISIFATSGAFCLPHHGLSERYQYRSEIGSKKTFLSTFQMLHTPVDRYRKWRESIDFFSETIARVAKLESIERPGVGIRALDGVRIWSDYTVKKKDTVHTFGNNDETSYAFVLARRLCEDLKGFNSFLTTNRITDVFPNYEFGERKVIVV